MDRLIARGQRTDAVRYSAPTTVICGGKSPAWMRSAMRELAAVVPGAQHRTLEGQTHIVKPRALAPMLVESFVR